MPLEFTYHVEPDENGVFDGRELARQLIGNAFRLACPLRESLPGLRRRPVQRHCQPHHRGTASGGPRDADDRESGWEPA